MLTERTAIQCNVVALVGNLTNNQATHLHNKIAILLQVYLLLI